jgi:glucan biosynthesis protein C
MCYEAQEIVMTAIEMQTTAKSQVKAEASKTSRLYFIDHMRSFLIILVVLHHVALVYGASLEGYYYVEPPFTSPSAFVALLVFTIFNQSWFMGAFFLLTGYFTPGSYVRKGAGSFLKDRLLLRNERSSSKKKPFSPGYLSLVIFTLALALVSYLWRMVVPLGKTVLQFPSLAYLPQYLSFFVIGVVASRHKWFQKIPVSMSLFSLAAAALAGVFLFPLAFSGHLFSLELTPALENAMGNGHWQSGVSALGDSIFAVGMCVGLLPLFRKLFSTQGWLGRFLSQQSYAVYIIHIPIIVYMAYAFRNVTAGSLLKFGLLSLVVVPLSFIVAGIIRKIPYVSKII